MNRELVRKRFLMLLLAASTLLLAILIRPLASALLTAAVLAGVLWPLQTRLARRLRRGWAAGVIVFGVVVVLVGPILGMSVFVVEEASKGIRFVSETVRSGGVDALVDKLPSRMQGFAKVALGHLEEQVGSDVVRSVTEKVQESGPGAAAAVARALTATWSFAFNATMMLIALFFLLVQGQEAVAWLDAVLPLGRGQTRELLTEFKKVSYAVVVATVVTALAQALAALVGYWIAQVPHPVFFAAITFFGAFIPAIGAASFSLLAALILLIGGSPYMALFLAIWSVTVVALADNVIKPLVIKGGMSMPGAVVFFSLIGGLGAFGPIGLMLGPLTVAFFVALLRMYRRDIEGQRPLVVPGS